MANKQIKDITTSSTTWEDTAYGIIQTAAGVTKKFTLAVLRKIVPASDSTTAFQVVKADGTTSVIRVDSTNKRLGVNKQSAPSAALHVHEENNAVAFLADFSYNGTNGSMLCGRKSRGTQAVPTAILAGDVIAEFSAKGYGSTTYSSSSRGYLRFYASENWTDTEQGVYARLYVTSNGGTTAVLGLQISDNGRYQSNFRS